VHIRNKRVLRDYISLLGMSERELARRAGLSHSTVNHLLTGRRSTCTAGTAHAIEAALDAPGGLIFSD
jgi:transcriptional regulator with XRE-family HTH domain